MKNSPAAPGTTEAGSGAEYTDNIPLISPEGRGAMRDLRWRELWHYHTLISFLAWRDIKVRYKPTILGVTWAATQPLFIALTLSLSLGRPAQVPSDGLGYPVFAYSALLLWQLFAQALTEGSNSLVRNDWLRAKVHFPRMEATLEGVI